MKILNMTLLVGGAAALFAAAPLTTPAHAQDAVSAATHSDWTLKQREDWLRDRINSSRDNGALSGHEYDRAHDALDNVRHEENAMRDRQDGQLTPNQTSVLEAKLDNLATRIHWANEANFALPW